MCCPFPFFQLGAQGRPFAVGVADGRPGLAHQGVQQVRQPLFLFGVPGNVVGGEEIIQFPLQQFRRQGGGGRGIGGHKEPHVLNEVRFHHLPPEGEGAGVLDPGQGPAGRVLVVEFFGLGQLQQQFQVLRAVAQGVDEHHPHLLFGPLQLADIPVVQLPPGHGVDDLDPPGHLLFAGRVEALGKEGKDALVLQTEPLARLVRQFAVAGPQGLDQGVPHPVVGEQLRVLVMGVDDGGEMAAALGGKGLHQGSHHRVGGVGQRHPAGPGWKVLQFPGDGHRPLGAEHRVAKGDGVQHRPGPVLAVRGQHRAAQLPHLGKDRAGLLQGGKVFQRPAEAEILRRQRRPGDDTGPQPVPQFI